MFTLLSIRNSPLNKSVDINFTKGINILKGKNSSGKSTVIEMLNYSLFGSSALRSSMGTYDKNFEVTCELIINRILYRIVRKIKDCGIYMFNEETDQFIILVTGVTSVNDYIKSLLTYDYKIYSLTNFCKQHELLKLTSCSPTQLTYLIEVVSGLDSSYRLLLSLKDSRKEAKAVVTSLSNTLSNSGGFHLSFQENSDFEAMLKENEETLLYLQKVVTSSFEQKQLVGNLETELIKLNEKLTQVEKEIEDSSTEIDSSLTEIEIKELMNQISILDNDLNIAKATVRMHTPPEIEYSDEYLNNQQSLIEANTEYLQYLKIKKEIDEHSITCPNCDHVFNDRGVTLTDIKTCPEEPELTLREIAKHREWNTAKIFYNVAKSNIERLLRAKQNLGDYNKLSRQLHLRDTIEGHIKWKNDILSDIDIVHDKLKKLGIDLTGSISENILKLISISSGLEEVYQNQITILNEFKTYIDAKQQYLRQQEIFSSLNEELSKNKNNLESYNLFYKVLNDIKKRIQTESFPVLNTIASNILSEITGGERNKVVITEDFKIEVDDNPIDTIEGSGKVIVNIALRIALLSTFYKDTFLVCLFDEIDESLHEDRFEYMQESFNKLADQGYQLILTSHKNYSVDTIIDMDSFKNV